MTLAERQRRLTKLQYQQLRHGMAHTFLNLEKLLNRKDVQIDSTVGNEIQRLASHLRNLDTTILENHEVIR